MNVDDIIKKFISTLTLKDMNDVEIMIDGYADDCLYICKLLHEKYDIHINPMHAYWLWLKFSVSWSAQWLEVTKERLDVAIEVISES